MMRRPLFLIGMLLVVMFTAGLPAWAQTEGEARLGGGSDIPSDTTVRILQGGALPPIHAMFADNPGADPIEVEFRTEAPPGISVDPEWDTKTIPAGGSVTNHFAVEVASSVAHGEYRVVMQLVRSDIEAQPGQITNIPAIQTAFTLEVVGDAASVTVRSVSSHSGEPVTATITLSVPLDDGGWFEIDRAQGDTLDARVASGEYRAAVLLGEREVAAEEFTIEADQTLDVALEVETVSFVVAAARSVREGDRLVVVELVAGVNNETEPIAGPNILQAVVSHEGVEVDTVILEEVGELPVGTTDAAVTYRPDSGWVEGDYSFRFELVTPVFTLTAPDQPVVDVPATGFDPSSLLFGLDLREAIAVAALTILGLVLIEQVVGYLVGRRSGTRAPRRMRKSTPTKAPRFRRSRRGRRVSRAREPELSRPIERLAAIQASLSDSVPDAALGMTPSSQPTEVPLVPAVVSRPQLPPLNGTTVDTAPTDPARSASSVAVSERGPDTPQIANAVKVIQHLHDEGRLAPGWSVEDASLVYWAMISPRMQKTLGSAGMSQKEYQTAMKRLFTYGLLGQGRPRVPS